MAVNFVITYHEDVASEDIPSLSGQNKQRIKQAIEEKLTTQPEIFGKPLRNSLKGYRSLRVGDYRIVYVIRGKIVKILVIKNRSVVYENVARRMT